MAWYLATVHVCEVLLVTCILICNSCTKFTTNFSLPFAGPLSRDPVRYNYLGSLEVRSDMVSAVIVYINSLKVTGELQRLGLHRHVP